MLRVIDARPEDIGRGVAKLAPEDLETLGLAIGDMISLMGKRRTVAKAMRTYVKDTNRGFKSSPIRRDLRTGSLPSRKPSPRAR
jgi:hypothetical protein